MNFFNTTNFENIFVDFYYKFNNTKFIKNYKLRKKYSISKISLIFNNKKFKIKLINYVFDLILQYFKKKSCILNKNFKIKEVINFKLIISYNNNFINTFFNFNSFLETYKKSKIVFLGIFGFNFKYFKLFVYDFYNFFGYKYFKKFYKDYFDFNFDFIYYYYINIKNIFIFNNVFNFFKLLLYNVSINKIYYNKLNIKKFVIIMLKKKIFKDFVYRVKYYSTESKNLCKKYFIKSYFIKSEIRVKSRMRLVKNFFKKQLTNSQINNKCLITNRSKILNKKFKISRIEFKRLVDLGFIKSYKRASQLLFFYIF